MDAEDGVERIGLSTGLCCLGVGGGLGGRASSLGSRIGATAVHELVAHELGDDIDVLRGTMVVRGCSLD